jgi:hypothetical protein
MLVGMIEPDERWRNTLAHLRAHHGAADRRQLFRLGWTDAMIATAIATGHLHRDHLGTYTAVAWSGNGNSHLAAGLLAAGRDAALTSTSAARLYGLHGLPRDGRVHVLVPHARVVQRPDASLVVRRSRTDDPGIRSIGGLAVTGPARTLIELGRDLEVDRLTEVLAHALHEGVVDPGTLNAEVVRCARTRGLPSVRAALQRLAPDDHRARARRERSVARLLRDHGLPRPRLAYPVDVDGGPPLELDLAYPEFLLAIEVDGGRWHRTPQQKRYDEIRQNRLTGRGWGILRFGEEQIDRTPRSVVRAVRTALMRRGYDPSV